MEGKVKVLYLSKTGYSRRLAEFLAKGLDSSVEELKIKKFEKEYEYVVFTGVYRGKLNGKKKLKKLFKKGLSLNIVTVGATSKGKNYEHKLLSQNAYLNQAKYFWYIQGGFDLLKCKFRDRLLIRGMLAGLKRKQNSLTSEERDLVKMCVTPFDGIKEGSVQAIKNHFKGNQV
ncbi:MAG: hypothetical protein NTX05_00515 [Fusobacteria bacterium]|nr:hypothetical protein [Fusobacteriota bacterium]